MVSGRKLSFQIITLGAFSAIIQAWELTTQVCGMVFLLRPSIVDSSMPLHNFEQPLFNPTTMFSKGTAHDCGNEGCIKNDDYLLFVILTHFWAIAYCL